MSSRPAPKSFGTELQQDGAGSVFEQQSAGQPPSHISGMKSSFQRLRLSGVGRAFQSRLNACPNLQTGDFQCLGLTSEIPAQRLDPG
jgi:hypothetical protein